MKNKRYHIVIGSILFAVLTWFSVNMRNEYTVVRRMPVVLENMREGKALKYPVPRFVTVRFRGSGWLIGGLYLFPNVSYFIDVSSLGSETFRITSHDILEHVKLPFAVQPVDIKPETLLLALTDYVERRVPVIPNVITEFHDGYGEVGSVRVSPESVDVSGSREFIDQLKGWKTAYQKFSDLRGPVNTTIGLDAPETYSVAIDRQNVRLTLNVQPFAEKNFSGVPVTASMSPQNYEVIFIPPKMDLTVRGGIDQLVRVSADDFEASVPYESLVRDSTDVVVPSVSGPSEVSIISRRPERFRFIIRKKL
jgi:hypothetical protein